MLLGRRETRTEGRGRGVNNHAQRRVLQLPGCIAYALVRSARLRKTYDRITGLVHMEMEQRERALGWEDGDEKFLMAHATEICPSLVIPRSYFFLDQPRLYIRHCASPCPVNLANEFGN